MSILFGDPVKLRWNLIIPVLESLGFAAGGSEFVSPKKNNCSLGGEVEPEYLSNQWPFLLLVREKWVTSVGSEAFIDRIFVLYPLMNRTTNTTQHE